MGNDVAENVLEKAIDEGGEMAESGLQVVVRFPDAIPHSVQGPALLLLELTLRTLTQQDVRVVKDLQGDDSKLRKLMTITQREKL